MAKRSIDFSDETEKILQERKTHKVSYGETANRCIQYLNPTKETKERLIPVLKTVLKQIRREEEISGEFEKEKLKVSYDEVMNIAQYLNGGHSLQEDEEHVRKQYMHIVDIKNGQLKCPRDWIILNQDDAAGCDVAYVIETSNAEVPHFVWLADSDYVCNVDSIDEKTMDYIRQLCINKRPDFKTNVIDKLVEPEYDEWTPGRIKNEKEVLTAPRVGIFKLYIEGTKKNYEPPYGARIIRNRNA